MDKRFAEDDVKKIHDFLNIIAKKAKFEFSVQDSIEFFKLLSWAQSSLIPKMEAHILEVKSIKTKDELEGKPKKS